jgi:sulfur-carrier protein adenylyltransferase/sulfurtransferase
VNAVHSIHARAGERIGTMHDEPAAAPSTAPSSGIATAARFARQLMLPGFDLDAQRRLGAVRVLVIGAGGLGSAVIPALAAAGIGTIGIVDDDVVESSNLHRQTIHGVADVGRNKARSAVDAVARLSPATVALPLEGRLTSENARAIFAEYDLVIDGSDNFATRYLVDDAARLRGIPVVWGAVSQFGGQASVSWAEHGPTYRDLFPAPPAPGSVLSCAEGGVMPTVCGVVGSIMAGEAIKLVTGLGDPLVGRVTTFDSLSGGFREIPYARDPEAAPIVELSDYESFCGVAPTRGTLSAVELAAELDAGADIVLLDVRESWEVEVAVLPDALVIPLGALTGAIDSLDPEQAFVVYCHAGIRSASALRTMKARGFTDVRHLDGGIDAWSRLVDPSVPRY